MSKDKPTQPAVETTPTPTAPPPEATPPEAGATPPDTGDAPPVHEAPVDIEMIAPEGTCSVGGEYMGKPYRIKVPKSGKVKVPSPLRDDLKRNGFVEA